MSTVTLENNLVESFSNFYKKLEKFEEKYGYGKPSNLEKWFELVQKRHKNLRKMFGNTYKRGTVELVSEDDCYYVDPQTIDNIRYYVAIILGYLPKYLETYNFEKSDLYKPILPNGHKTTKHISTYIKKNNKSLEDNYTLTSYISELGSCYKNQTVKANKYKIKITTSAFAFCQLGHYGVDNGSCFGQRGERIDNKHALAMMEDSFVVLLSDDRRTLSRCFGFYERGQGVVNLTNFYTKHVTERTAISAIIKGLAKIFKISNICVEQDLISAEENLDIYLNGVPCVSILERENAPAGPQYLPDINADWPTIDYEDDGYDDYDDYDDLDDDC